VSSALQGEQIRVTGLVQGVGFRPTVWRLAKDCGLRGEVWNDGAGVTIRAWGRRQDLDRFCERLLAEPPPLASIAAIVRDALDQAAPSNEFRIVASRAGPVRTGIVADAATCEACRREILDSQDRRYRYPFTNCTHCGPRLSIVRAIPYDRANTSMAAFSMCPACQAEYDDPADRRFHAQPNACPACGPRVWLVDGAGIGSEPVPGQGEDVIAQASELLGQGKILAIKGIGGFHLACDAGQTEAVAELRRRKGRFHKPFALMARDLAVIRRYARLGELEAQWLQSPAAPILLLERNDQYPLPEALAPGQRTLGFMLPYTPLHHLLLRDWERPLVMTSGNLSEEPQCIDNRDAASRLQPLADAWLLHDREIVNRVDDSVVRVMDGSPRLLRRARGYAPSPLPLPPGFEQAEELLALGGELKNTFCLLKDGQAILSQHLGDLENELTFKDFTRTLELYARLFEHRPRTLVGDLHPNYRTTRYGRELAARRGLVWRQVQHHHAHIASVLAEHRWPLQGGRVLGIALDGSGYGPDGTIWGGEVLLADYQGYQRLGWLRPVPLPGGTQAILQPWRNSFAQLHSLFGWQNVRQRWGGLEAIQWLDAQPLELLQRMIERGLNAPLTSSCGRLFDALAGLLGVCRERISYEGQAAIEFEALIRPNPDREKDAYPFELVTTEDGASILDPKPLWTAVLSDLQQAVPAASIAERFHAGLADALCELALRLSRQHGITTIALSGGVLQNRTLFEALTCRLRAAGLEPLSHRRVPANDGGLALGQAVIAAAGQIAGMQSC
jgi:hydrogenase maturation protein HypF